ncbi:MAG TPA: plastocyanin/azurin family copper-binding protein [Candidatus Limnocylindria bacterium]|nr:plastocyanin/azurin family copper-binding protein [Candidatus Limnocylindria bacterium]
MRIAKLTGLLIAASLAIGACSGSSTPVATAAPASAAPSSAGGGGGASAVTIQNLAFNPPTLTVKVGTEVTWTNQDSAAHTVTFDTGGATSDNLAQGATYKQTFSSAGTLAYHCKIHAFMTATITVTP